MIRINLKDLYPADSQQQLTDKLNYNFNQLLRLGVGQPGPQGDDGPPGNQGIPGLIGPPGVRGSYWYSGNYSDPSLDPAMSGSPDPRNVNDFYLTTASGNLAMWQYKAGTPNYWEMAVDLEQAISVHISATSPFTRPAGSPPPPNWNSIIIPYPVPSTGMFNNTLFMSSEYQTQLYTGAYASDNSTAVRNTQMTLLGGVLSPIKYAIAIGEIDYTYSGGMPDTANPKVRLNNTLRISTKYKHSSPKTMPLYASSEFDAASYDDGQSINDVTTGFAFKYRHVEPLSSRADSSVYFASKRFLDGYGLNFGDINDSSVDLGGIVISNTVSSNTSAVAIGTNMNFDYGTAFSTPYGYILANNNVQRMYVNKNWIPLKITHTSVIDLGMAGTTYSQWDNLYLKSGIGYTDQEPLKFWRNVQSSAYGLTDSNCVMALTTAGKLAIGSSISNYKGVGSTSGLSWGTSPSSTGNDNNKAALHIYEEISTAPEVALLDEAGLLVEKKWGYLDRFSGTGLAGTKMGLFVHNAVDIQAGAAASPGTPEADLAPDAIAAYIMQGQRSANLSASVITNMTGLNVYSYANANAANVVDVVGVISSMEFLLSSGTTSTRANSTIAFKAVVPTAYVTGTIGSNYKRYGFYQTGATDAINRFDGHVSFGGSGSGHTIPGYGAVSGHAIDVESTHGSSLHIVSGMALATGSGGNLHLYAGYGGSGSAGGHAILMGGSTDGADNSGDVYVMAGTLALSDRGKTGGNVYVSGAACNAVGTHAIVGTVFISPSVEIDDVGAIQSAGNIVIGYAKIGSALGTGYDYGNQGKIGFGTTNPIEKAHVNGNIVFSANSSAVATTQNTRLLYVQDGIMNGDNNNADGAGAHLKIQAGNAKSATSTLYKGGSIYLSGGEYAGTSGSYAILNDGNVFLAWDGSQSIGRVAIRKNTAGGTYGSNIHVDISGNVRTDRDIMWAKTDDFLSCTPGWAELMNFSGGAGYDDSFMKMYKFTGSYIPESVSAASITGQIYISCKRIGTIGIINYVITIPSGISEDMICLGWDSASANNTMFGEMLAQRMSGGIVGINFWGLTDAPYTLSYITNANSCLVNAGITGEAVGDIPAAYNVLVFNTSGYSSGERNIRGQIIVSMAL